VYGRHLKDLCGRFEIVLGAQLPLEAWFTSASYINVVAPRHTAAEERGIYEACLFLAFTAVTTDLWLTEDLQALVDHADRKKLLAAGDSLPPGRQFTVYRGVAG